MAAFTPRPLAVVTGASSGIGLELARCCVHGGYDALIAAEDPAIYDVALGLRASGANIEVVQTDLATAAGVEQLYWAIDRRPVAALIATAGHALSHEFLDERFEDVQRAIDTNVTGPLYLLHKIGSDMRAAGEGRILITGSSADLLPGSPQAVHSGTKALLDAFAVALRAELKGSGVSVTTLLPDANESELFEAGTSDSRATASRRQAPETLARMGFEAMQRGDAEAVTGWTDKLRAAFAHLVPSAVPAHGQAGLTRSGNAAKAH